jgi:phage shock protein E
MKPKALHPSPHGSVGKGLALHANMMNADRATPAGSPARARESISPVDLLRQIEEGSAPAILDVREAGPFQAGHIAGALHAPDSLTTALVRKVQALDRAVLVCDTGKVSAMVRRTLGFCGFHAVSYLEGGLRGWIAAGGGLVEITRSGAERALDLPDDVDDRAPRPAPPPSRWRRMFAVLAGSGTR